MIRADHLRLVSSSRDEWCCRWVSLSQLTLEEGETTSRLCLQVAWKCNEMRWIPLTIEFCTARLQGRKYNSVCWTWVSDPLLGHLEWHSRHNFGWTRQNYLKSTSKDHVWEDLQLQLAALQFGEKQTQRQLQPDTAEEILMQTVSDLSAISQAPGRTITKNGQKCHPLLAINSFAPSVAEIPS